MSDTFSILFYVRNYRVDKKGTTMIYLRITVDGHRAELSLQRKVQIKQWNPISGRVKGTNPRVKELNRFLDDVQARLLKIQGEYVKKGKYYTADLLKNDFLGRDNNHRTLLKLYQEHNDEISELVGREFSVGGYQRHVRTRRHLKSFIKKEYKIEDLPLRDVDLQFIKRFEHYLKVSNIGGRNTVTKYLVNFKKIIRIAYAYDWINKDPFYHWKATWEPVEREALTERELDTLMKEKFDIDRLNHVKDIFLFCCFTGLAYSDVKKLSDEHIVKNLQGQRIIKTQRAKTNTRSTVPLLEPAEKILQKYQDYKLTNPRGLLLPVISNQKLNAYLKEIATVCKITKKLTFHLARHTFATTVTLANGVPIESVSRMLGHSSLKTTQIYAKVVDQKLLEDMKVVRNKYESTLQKKAPTKKGEQLRLGFE